MFDTIIGWASFVCYLASPAVAFWLTAMAWQRYPHRAFLLLALSSMLTLLLVVMSAVEARQNPTQAEQLAYWRCSRVIMVIDGVLYPWSLFLLFRFIRERMKTNGTDSSERNVA